MADNSEFPTPGTDSTTETGSARPPSSAHQVIVGLSMIAALVVVSVIVGRMEAKTAAPATVVSPAPAAPAPAPETPAAPAPTEALATEVKTIKSQLDGLSAEIKGVQGKFDALPKPESGPDLKPIQGKVDGLVKSVAVLLPLSEKVGTLDGHVGGLVKQLEGLGAEVSALKKVAAKPDDHPKLNQTSDESPPAFGEAIDLFKKGKFKDALDRFRKLTEADDKDARVWYFAAVSSGLATANWTGGDALTYVKKGIEREQAGSPATQKIDAAFADLTAQTGKDWLDFYRKSVK